MKFKNSISVKTIADLIDAKLIGNTDGMATGINEINRVEVGDLAFVDHPKYYNKCINSNASFIIINKVVENIPSGKALLVVDNPFEGYCKIVSTYYPTQKFDVAIAPNSSIGKNTVIHPGVFIGSNVIIGENCEIFPNVTILQNCIIGNNVIIQSGTVVGGDAFYYNTKKDREIWYKKMPSCGHVIIEDFVEVGCGCTIDRGVTHETRIGQGSKLDNMVHIGHDTVVGKNCLFAAQVGVAGCTTIEDGVTLWGQVGVNKTLTIGKNTTVMGQSGVSGNLEANKTYFGTPAEIATTKKRELVWVKRIPEIWKKIKE